MESKILWVQMSEDIPGDSSYGILGHLGKHRIAEFIHEGGPCAGEAIWNTADEMVDFLIGHYTYRIFPPAIDIIPTLLAVVYSNGKYTN